MERGVHVFAWMNSTSYIPGEWEANREYPYVKWFYPDGTAWWDEKDGDHWIDFTDPAAMNWAYKRFEPFLGKGLYGTMLDFNDRIRCKRLLSVQWRNRRLDAQFQLLLLP